MVRATMPPVQMLVTGDVLGKLGRLFKRVETVNQKNGPFAAVFCVGEFFPSEEETNADKHVCLGIAVRTPLHIQSTVVCRRYE